MKLRQLTLSVLLLALPLLALWLAVGSANAMTAIGDGNAMSSDQTSSMPFESKLLPSDGVAGEKLGNSVSLGENMALVSGAERAYVYRWNGTSWVEEQKLTASDGSPGQRFGLSVSVYGEVAIVGSDYDDDNGEKSGSAYVFRWNGSSWVEEAKLTPSDATAGDGFGFDVALHGNVALVGAYGNQSHTGSAYVFRWNGTSWVEEAKLIANDRTQGDQFAYSLSVHEDVILIGARYDDHTAPLSGSAYVYRWDGTNWNQETKLRPSDGRFQSNFGSSVSVEGNVALIGAELHDKLGFGAGAAYVYRWNGSEWIEEAQLLASDGDRTDQYGRSVSLNGNLALVGAIGNEDNGGHSGSAYLYQYNGSAWAQVLKLNASDGATTDLFGHSVSFRNNLALISAWQDDDNGEDSGSAYVYDLSSLAGNVVYVKHNANGANNGTSWTDAYTDLQDALAGAEAGNEIWVAAGTYKPTGGTDRRASFQLKNGIAIYGGFAGTETTRNQRDWQTNSTILSGDLNGNDNDNVHTDEATRADNSYHVVYANGTDHTAILSGFTITAGNGNTPGGTLDDSGGMRNQSSSATLTNLIFTKNSAISGGGMSNYYNSTSTLTNVTFTNNFASGNGGGMANVHNNAPTLINVTFSNNSTNGYGGGMANSDNSNPTVTNSIFWGNSAPNGAQIYNDNSSPTVSYSLVQGGYAGTGNIDADPLFVDAANANLRLQAGSPAINSGNNDALPQDTADCDGDSDTAEALPCDLHGNPRVTNGSVDMGAYEYQGSSEWPDIAVSPDSFSVTLTEGQSSSETLVIHNTGTNDLDWQVSGSAAWLTASSTSGTVTPNGSQSLTININTARLTEGSHSGTVTITSNDPDEPSISVPVILTVNSPLQLGKTVSAATAQPGDGLTYTIVVTATEYTSNIRLIDQLPMGLSYVASTVTGGATYEDGDREIRYTGSVTPGTPLVITYQATVDSDMQPGTVLYNAAELTSGETRLDAAASVAIPDHNVNQTLVLLYVNGDNDLSEFMPKLVSRAEQGAGNEHLTVLLLLDGPEEKDTYLYRLEEDDDPSCPSYKNPTCDGRYVLGQNLWQWGENIANPYSLHDFLIGAQRAYPQANRIILSLVGHGGGWAPTIPGAQPGKRHGVKPGGLLWDDHVESSLSTAELGQALRWFQQKTGRKIDLLYLDACLMAMSEVAYELRESVDYLLASESWSWTSFSYDAHLNAINESTTAREIGEAWLANEAHVLRDDKYPFTYSLIDLSQMTTLREAQDSLANALSATLPDDKEKIDEAFKNSACFDSDNNGFIVQTGSTGVDDYCDLYSFTQQIKTRFNGQSALFNAAQKVQNAISSAVVAKDHHNGIPSGYSNQEWSWEELGGLSIYLPLREDKWGRGFYHAGHLQMAKDGQWDEFLTNAYWNNAQPPNAPDCPNGDCEPPGPWRIAPISIQASGGQDSINVNWNLQGSFTDTLDYYELYRTGNDDDYQLISSGMESQYTDDNLTPRSEYCYYVRVFNGDDNVIGLSNVACVEFGPLELWIPNEVVSPNDTNVLVPINLENGNGLCIGAMEVVISYDSSIARPTGEVKSTIYSQGYEFELIDTQQPGTIKIASSTGQCQALRGAGQLFTVGFEIIGSQGEVNTLGFIGGLNGTVMYDDDDLYTPLELALQHGSLKIGNSFIRGDINGDGVINIADLVFSGRIANHKITPTPQQMTACDINGDQVCTSADTTLIQCYRRKRDWDQCGGSQSRHLVAREHDAQDGPAKVVMGTIENGQSGRIRVPVRLTNAPNFAGGDFTFSYNAEQMSATGATLTSLTEDFELETNFAQSGLLHLSLASEDAIQADGTILMLEFTMTDQRSNRLLSDDGSTINLGTVRLNDTTGRDFETSALQQDIEGSFCLADLNDDNKIDIVDVQAVSSRWNTQVGDSQYDPLYDLEGDGEIDIFDVQYVASRWNTTCQTTQ